MTEINIHYDGELHCHATHKASGATLQTDAPVDNHGRGENFSPTDLAAAALGTCMATLMAIAAEQRGINIKGAHAVVQKEMSKTGPRRIVRLTVDYFVPLAADHPQRELLEAAALNCPIHYSLHPDIEQKIQFHYQT